MERLEGEVSMNAIRTTIKTEDQRQPSSAGLSRLAGLLLCVMFAASELLESLLRPGRSPEDRPA